MSNQQYRQKLVITLNSDLCAAVGDGFSGNVDIDVCHDDKGVPIIPARRIKGCLKDAANILNLQSSDGFDGLFGTSGASVGGSLRVSDAVLFGSDEAICNSLSREDAQDPQKVLGLFTYTRAQTAIGEDGSARDNTLRFMRVVKQYMPSDSSDEVDARLQPARFVADVSCADDESQKKLLVKCCKALRAIGHGRNRGFGAVSCKLEQADSASAGSAWDEVSEELNDAVRISYTVRLDSPIMLPQQQGTESVDYIPGTSVLGFFASKLSGADAFDDIFLRGRVRFSPLYPVEGEFRCCPAPPFIVKLKGGMRDGLLCSSWQVLDGEVPKPLKSGFVSGDLNIVKSETEIIYHNNIADPDGGLYTQRCIKAGQLFSGFIEGDVDSISTITKLLTSFCPGEISFGRSRTAQYSRCSLVGIEKSQGCSSVNVRQGNRYAFLLDSDALVLRDGAYSVAFADLEEAIRTSLGDCSSIYNDSDVREFDDAVGTGLRYRAIGGYNAKWNQKKPHVRAIGAGSCIVFEAASDAGAIPGEFFIGERQAEGFGRVLLVGFDSDGNPDLPLDSAPLQLIKSCVNASCNEGSSNASIEILRCTTVEYAGSWKKKLGGDSFGRAFIGRLARMVEEANCPEDLDRRIDSIKTDSKKSSAMKLIKGFRGALGQNVPWTAEKECLALLFALAKYYAKQSEPTDSFKAIEGGAR